MKTISERIKEALEIRDMKQTDLVKLTGITKGALSSYISGSYEPKQRNIYRISKALNVNEAWLMGLDVPMEKSTDPDVICVTEVKLINIFNKLNETGKKEAIKRVSELTEINKYTTLSTQEDKSHLIAVAAHDDNLTDDEKKIMDERINEALKAYK